MYSKRLATLAVLTVVGAVLLSACDPVEISVGTGSPPESAAPYDAEAVAGDDVTFVDGLALDDKVAAGTGDLAGPDASPEARAKWVQVAAGATPELSPLLMNGFGRVMYRFDKDTAKPSKSACDAECAEKWPPVVVAKGATVYFKDVAKEQIGLLERADGTRQLTVGGWPAYYYAGDTELADTKGQGVDGAWFGMGPDGAKAPAVGSVEDNLVELFADPGFAGDSFGQYAGFNCLDVSASGDDLASSMKVRGKVKIWSEKKCKGKSLDVDKDVDDLRTVGFDDTISSIFLG